MRSIVSRATRAPTAGQVAQGTVHLMLGRLVLMAAGYGVTVIIARGLGPSQYGIYGVIVSVLLWIEQLGRFGLPEAVAKLAAENDDTRPEIESTTQTLGLTISLLLLAVSWGAAPWLARLFDIPGGADLFRLAVLDVPVMVMYVAYQGIVLGRRRFSVIGGGLAVYGLTKLTGIWVAHLLGLSIIAALIVNVVGTVGAFLFIAVAVPRPGLHVSRRQVGRIMTLAMPAGLFVLMLQVLSNLDLWALKIDGGEATEVVGLYVAATNVARVPSLAFSVINGVVLPSLALAIAQRDLARTHRYVRGAGRFLFVTLAPTSVAMALTAPEIMALLYSDRYAGGAPFLVLQVFAFALIGVAIVLGEMLIARGDAALTAGLAVALVPVGLSVNLLLLPRMGAMGSATALLLTALGLAGVTAFFVVRRLGPLLDPSTFGRVALATIAMILVATQIQLAGPWLLAEYVLLFGTYTGVLALLGELTWSDLHPFAVWRTERA